MKAKTASKILNDHLAGNHTEISRKMFSEIAAKLIASGINPPFGVKGVKIAQGHLDDFLTHSHPEEDSDFMSGRYDMKPEVTEFETGREKGKDTAIIPVELIDSLENWEMTYKIAEMAKRGEEVPVYMIKDAIDETSDYLREEKEKMNRNPRRTDSLSIKHEDELSNIVIGLSEEIGYYGRDHKKDIKF